MHSTACGVGASTGNSTTASIQSTDGIKMVHSNDDAMNKIPLKSASGLDDEEKNGGEFIHDTAAAEEARREQLRQNILKWMKKLTIVLICFIGIALISYVIISLCFSDWPKNTYNPAGAQNDTAPPTAPLLSSPTTAAAPTSHLPLAPTSASTTPTSPSPSPSSSTYKPILSVDETSSSTESLESVATSPHDVSKNSDDDSVLASSIIRPPSTTVTSSSAAPSSATTTTTKTPLVAPIGIEQDAPITDPKFVSRLGVYENAAVCSDKEICSQIGSNILAKDGSAVDAAIATLFCNGIVNMQSMGIGGGMLMNVYIRNESYGYAIDARETAPYASTPEMFDHTNINSSLNGGLAIAVPGELMGYHKAHERFGKLPWKQLVQPAIKLCLDGFYLSKHMKMSLEYKKAQLRENKFIHDAFFNANTGDIHPIGTKVKPHRELCETYQLIAENGAKDFYNGTLAQLVLEDLKDLGSPIDSYDLETYTADLVSSITMPLGENTLYSMPPISSGVVVSSILSMLEGFNLTKASMQGDENIAQTIHRMTEAMKFAFAKRWELGDVRFNDVRELVSQLTSPSYNSNLRLKINDSSVQPDYEHYDAQFAGKDDMGTSHTVVMAPNGDVVSVTSSINYYFGANTIGRRTGIIFNNGMNDFSIAGQPTLDDLPIAPSNMIDAGKRSMSSMSPLILTDRNGNVKLAVGSAGGAKIISAVAEVMARVLWFGENIKEAIDAPRFHHQLVPNVLQYENKRFSENVLSILKSKGHIIKPYYDVGSVACGISRNSTAIYANADFRKQGGVAGY